MDDVMVNLASCDPIPVINKRMLPPWVVFSHDGMADILPAGRPGHIIKNIPLVLAERIVNAANS